MALLLFLGACRTSPSSRETTFEDLLAEKLGSWRAQEMRLHPQWSHHPWQPSLVANQRKARRPDLVALEVKLTSEFSASPTWENRWPLIWLNLAWGHGAGGLALLEEAPPFASNAFLTQYALATANMLLAIETGDARNGFRALSHIDAALRLKPLWSPALFNRALILESLFLRDEAQRAWHLVIREESDPEWRAEAQQRLDKLLVTQLTPQWDSSNLAAWIAKRDAESLRKWRDWNSQSMREALEREWLTKWADSLLKGSAADAVLQDLEWACRILSEAEPFLIQGVVEHLKQMNPSQQRILAEGHLALASGVKALKDFDFQGAKEFLIKAEPLLGQWHHPGKLWVDYAQAELHFYQGNRTEAKAKLRHLLGDLPPESYPSLLGRLQWMLGLICQFEGLPIQAGRHFDQARIAFAKASDPVHLAGVLSLLGENERFLGHDAEAFSLLLSARRILASHPDARRGYAMSMFANRLIAAHYPQLVAYFLEEAHHFADSLGHPQSQVYTHLLTAQSWLDQDNATLALRHIRFGQGLAPSAPDASWLAMLAQLKLAEAEALLAMDPPMAMEALRAAEALIFEGKRDLLKEPLYRLRAKLHRHQGKFAEAERDLLQGVQLLESLRTDMADPNKGQAFFQQARPIFEALVENHLETGEIHKAWTYTDRFGVSATRLTVSKGEEAVLQLQTLQDLLPEQVTFLRFWVQDSRVSAWLIGKSSCHYFPLNTRETDLTKCIDDLHTSLVAGRDASHLFSQLSQALLEPLTSVLPSSGSLVVIPDGVLHGLPFGALPHPETQRLLLEDFDLSFAPSAAQFLSALQNSRTRSQPPLRALIVGNPRFDPKTFRHVRSLPGSLDEAKAVAALIPQATLWVEDMATGKRILDSAGNFELLHFGGHAATGAVSPGFDHLLVAATDEDPGIVYAHQIAHAPVGKLRLVTLAACATNSRTHSGRPNALVTAFLEAGVPTVVAHAWDVEDSQSKALLLTFYRGILEGQTPAAAMRKAQLEALASGLAFRHWAGFQVHGGWVRLP